jgi:hypothetical protein
MEKELHELNSILRKVYKQNTLGHIFVRGIVAGLGSVIGATVVVGFVAYFLGLFNFLPYMDSLQSLLKK